MFGRSQQSSIFSFPTERRRGSHTAVPSIAAIDFETTGLSADSDRVVEIAVVRMSLDGTRHGEFSTLVHPERDVGPTFIHHITNEAVLGAPRFADVIGAALPLLEGAVVVSHYAEFEQRFLEAELVRAGLRLPVMPALCTCELARSTITPANYRLSTCCEHVALDDQHTGGALGDARLKAALALHFLHEHGDDLRWEMAPPSLPRVATSGKPLPRVTGLRKGGDGWMANVLKRLPLSGHDADQEEAEIYLHAVAGALEDGKLTGDEAKQLARLAGEAGLGAAQVESLHRQLLEDMRAVALADGVLSKAEIKTLTTSAALLGINGYFDDLVAAHEGGTPIADAAAPAIVEAATPADSSTTAASPTVDVAVSAAAAAATAAPAWYPDPRRRAEYRWFDGQSWTAHIANAGTASIDPHWPG